jgi:hypothetical protein
MPTEQNDKPGPQPNSTPTAAEARKQQLVDFLIKNSSQHDFSRITAVGVGVQGEGLAEEILVFHEPVDACEFAGAKAAIQDEAGKTVQFLPTGRFVGLQATSGASIGIDAPSRYNVPPDNASTLGAVIDDGTRKYVLGCNHSLAFNGRAVGAPATSPSPIDENPPGSVIGRVAAYEPLQIAAWPIWTKLSPLNPVDCALAEIRSSTVIGPRPVTPLATAPAYWTDVRKIGRTTGRTYAKIRIRSLSGFVDLGSGTYFFDQYVGVVTDPPFAHPGDSGSLVVVEPPAAATGAPGVGPLPGVGLATARVYCSFGPYQGYIVAICSLELALQKLAPRIGVQRAQMTVMSV